MANITLNRINTVLSVTDIASIITDLENALTLLPELGLTPQELKSLKGVSVGNKVFTEDCIIHLKQNGTEIMPPYININELINDFEFNKQLNRIESTVNQVKNRVAILKRITSKEEYDVALQVYELYEKAAHSGVPGASAAYEHLNERFKKHKGRPADKRLKK
ncbi:MAG: hypothetical protein V4548_03565 [Bacteroidota bacterium]